MKTESKQPERLEWSAPELKKIAVNATKSGGVEDSKETNSYVFTAS